MKLAMLAAAAVISIGALTLPGLPGQAQAATMGATAITAPTSHAIQDVRCHWHRVRIRGHRGPHGHWHPGHWSRHRVCH
jgi:hypothetical protein